MTYNCILALLLLLLVSILMVKSSLSKLRTYSPEYDKNTLKWLEECKVICLTSNSVVDIKMVAGVYHVDLTVRQPGIIHHFRYSRNILADALKEIVEDYRVVSKCFNGDY